MTNPKFDQDFWEQLWSKTLRDQPEKVARRPPNAHLMADLAAFPPAVRSTRAVDTAQMRSGSPRTVGR